MANACMEVIKYICTSPTLHKCDYYVDSGDLHHTCTGLLVGVENICGKEKATNDAHWSNV